MELLESSLPAHKPKPVNIKRVILKYLRKWPWFLLSMAVFYTAAKIYLRYVEPQYFSKTNLMVQQSKNTASASALNDMKNLGMGVSGNSELEGETVVIVSKPILGKVAKNLNLDVSFFAVGKIKEVEMYANGLTGKIIKLYSPNSFSGATYFLHSVGKNSYKLIDEKGSSSSTIPFGVPAKLPFGTIQIDIEPGMKLTSPLKVIFKNINRVSRGLENSITVSLPQGKGMLMELSTVGPVPKKSEDILNELTKQYILDGINDKNQEAEGTQEFINDRLAIITEDLSGIEGQKENFKRQNGIVNLEQQGSISLENLNENTKQILTNSMELELVNAVLSASSGEQLLPTGLGLSPALETNISEYNNLVLTRNRVLKQATGENPAVIEMNKQIAAMKNLIRKNLIEARETLQLKIGQANAQLNVAKGNISRYPTQEKIFRSIDRQQTLKEQLYLYLLQKREENAITLAVTAPKAKVVNPAFTTGIVQPKYDQILYGSLAAGFLLPLLFFYTRNMLDTKVHSRQQILSHIPDASVIAEIPENDEDYAMVKPNDFSVFAESFRILGSNLKFLLKTKATANGGVVLVTSSVKGEGKTTISMNIALTLAGKNKVIVIGADIRNPQLHRFVEGKNIGLTDFLISDETVPDKWIVHSKVNDNLDVLFSGQIAPNPNDLLDMQKFDDMIGYLKTKYEFIILDSAPVMLVSDTLHLIENSDVVLYAVKSDFTEKEMIDFAEGFRFDNNIRNMAFVLNEVKPENTRYGKKYGYGYYSYTHDEKPPLLERMKFWKW